MKRFLLSSAVVVAVGTILLDGPGVQQRLSAAVQGENDYFDALSRRADVWRVASLRDPAQLAHRSQGGYAEGYATPASGVTYSPSTDTDRHKQDAAKVVVPQWLDDTKLTRAVASGDDVFDLESAYKPSYPAGRIIRVDREVMVVAAWLSDTSIKVSRAQYNTALAAHGLGAVVQRANNSLRPQVRVPLATEDGHSYFFTWDSYWTDSYAGAGDFNHKAFQFSSGSSDGDAIFLESDATYGGKADNRSCWQPGVSVTSFHVRSYNKIGGVLNWLLTDGDHLGPSATSQEPLGPGAYVCSSANQWVRFFVNIRQRLNDYDYVDMWIADETRDPVQVLFNVPISVRPTGKTPHSIAKFWLEFNSSSDAYWRLDNRDLVTYVRNFVALRDNSDPRPLLVRPVPGAQAADVPSAPRNVRIIQGS